MSSRTSRLLTPLAWSVACACAANFAHADTQIQATASYRLDGGSTVFLRDPVSGTQSSGTVDVLEFPYGFSSNSSAGIHTYGSVSGDFGSRSSGQGDYDVTGRFVITRTITNSTDTAQQANFNFYITPGWLSNDVRSDLSASGRYVDAGIRFDIQRNGAQVWGSQAQLRTDASGTVFTQSGADLYTQSGVTTYTIAGGQQSVSLGVIGAGESVTLQYELSTFARGLAPASQNFRVPSQTVVIPEQTIFYPEATYDVWVYDGDDYGGYGCEWPQAAAMMAEVPVGEPGCGNGRWETVTREAYTEVIPERTVVTESFLSNSPSGSHASSGDPFDIDFLGGVQSYFDPVTGQMLAAGPAPFSITVTPVPEPSTWVMMFTGLMALGVAGARRRSSAH